VVNQNRNDFGLPRKNQRPAPWWEYKEPYDSFGLTGAIAYKGLLNRAAQLEGEVLYSWLTEGCYEGTWDNIMADLWEDRFSVVHEDFLHVADAEEGQEWPEDPRPVNKLVASFPDGSIEVRHSPISDPPVTSVEVYTSDKDLYWKVRRWCEQKLTPIEHKGVVRCLSRPKPNSSFHLITLGRFEDTYEPENYEPEVIEKFSRLIADLNSHTPRGRMAIIHGTPGTGKTYLLKAITQACPKALVIYVPNTLVADLGNPELIEVFTNSRKDVSQRIILLAEDADVIFRRRSEENTNAISSALNLTDGMFGELLKIYVVGTTNVEMDEIDPAIKRPGRLSEEIHVGRLSPERTAAVYRRLKENPEAPIPESLKQGGTLAEVYSTAEVYQKKKVVKPFRNEDERQRSPEQDSYNRRVVLQKARRIVHRALNQWSPGSGSLGEKG